MNILFLTIGRVEDLDSHGIYTDLLREFRNNGHNVYVVSPREKRLKKETEFISLNGAHFLRVKIGNITKTNVIEKGISTLKIESLFLAAIKEYLNDVKFDLVIYSTPPITFEKVIRYIKIKDHAKSYLLLKDIFPQNALDIKVLSKANPIYWHFRYKEKKLYKVSDYIGCMSQANVDYILRENPTIPQGNVEICPNSIQPLEVEKNKERVVSIRKKYNIPLNKTTFVYGGNLGRPQGVDFLMKCLKENEFNNEVYFVIVGSGTEFKKLEVFFEKEQLSNAQLLSQLPKNEYETLANSCDVGLIFLDWRFTIPNFPSRILSYMKASMPVLAATDINTDVGQVIEQGGFGYWCESKNVSQFNELVNKLCDENLRFEMGRNARKYLEENYTAKHSYEIIMNHFR